MCMSIHVCVGVMSCDVIMWMMLLQSMAIATLSACYNNPRVFTGVVKIRKGQAVELMMASTNMDNLKYILAQHTVEVGHDSV